MVNHSEYHKKVVSFMKHWTKLDNRIYSTIRHSLVLKEGYAYPVILKNEGKIQDIVVNKRERIILLDYDVNIILKDTDTRTLRQALDIFNYIRKKGCEKWNKIYKPYDFKTEKFNLYTLEVIKKYRNFTLDAFLSKENKEKAKQKQIFKSISQAIDMTPEEIERLYEKNKDDFPELD